jgi:hypothetical protein
MKRKTTGTNEPKSERFNMFLSPSELQAIDDWAWRHRIRSKSEAIRRLCQIGIVAEREIDIAKRRFERAMKALSFAFDKPDSQFEKAPKGLRAALALALREQIKALKAITALEITASLFENGKDTSEVDEIMKKVDVWMSLLKEEKK